MAFENFPSAARQEQPSPPKFNWMALIACVLFFSLSGAIGYIIWYKNQSIDVIREKIVEEKPLPVLAANNNPGNSDQLNELQKELTDATMRYDMLKTLNARKDTANSMLEKQIAQKKDTIFSLLNKAGVSATELNKAKAMIASLKDNIEGFKTQVEKITGEKAVLAAEKKTVTEQRDQARSHFDSAVNVISQKEDSIDIGSTLSAVDFTISGINEKNNGKEKQTSVARKVDKLHISFQIAQNRLAASGIKDMYVCVTDPHGFPITVEALGSGKFVTRNGAEKFYTQKLDVDYIQGSPQAVSFDWRQNTDFEPGDYKIQVYNNGFKIGQGVTHLK